MTERPARCFRDYRSAARIEYRLETLAFQRVLGLAAGYGDLHDPDRLRVDSVLALASGCADLTGERRRRVRDREQALAVDSAHTSRTCAACGHADAAAVRRVSSAWPAATRITRA